MPLLDRRRFLVVLGGSAAGIGVGARVAAMPTQTMWMLDPDWGFPLETDNGSDIKSRCRGRACHLAAPHRFFLTEADALAGRLHICCLAQPVAVAVSIDLNELMPYYQARHGGVDARCPELPTDLRQALYAAVPLPETPGPEGPEGPDEPDEPDGPDEPDEESLPPTTPPVPPAEPTPSTPTNNTPTGTPTAPTGSGTEGSPTTPAAPAAPTAAPNDATPAAASPSSLPATGVDVTRMAVGAGLVTALGLAVIKVAGEPRDSS